MPGPPLIERYWRFFLRSVFTAFAMLPIYVNAQALKTDIPTIDIPNGIASATPIAIVPFAVEYRR